MFQSKNVLIMFKISILFMFYSFETEKYWKKKFDQNFNHLKFSKNFGIKVIVNDHDVFLSLKLILITHG